MSIDGEPENFLEVVEDLPLEIRPYFLEFFIEKHFFDPALASLSTQEERVAFVKEVWDILGSHISLVQSVPIPPVEPVFMNGVRLKSIHPDTLEGCGVSEGQYVRLFFDGSQFFSVIFGRLIRWGRHPTEFYTHWKIGGVV